LSCLFVAPAKLANPQLKDGTCAEQGYTEATGETQEKSGINKIEKKDLISIKK
jgi:hypothetical protein